MFSTEMFETAESRFVLFKEVVDFLHGSRLKRLLIVLKIETLKGKVRTPLILENGLMFCEAENRGMKIQPTAPVVKGT